MSWTALRQHPSELSLADTHRVHEGTDIELRGSSEALGWHNLLMLDYHERPCSASFAPVHHPLLVYQRRGTVRLTGRVAGALSSKTVYLGQLHLVPADADIVLTADRECDSLHLYVSADLVTEAFREQGQDGGLLGYQFAIQDPLLASIIQACAMAMRSPTDVSATYVDHLSWALASHLVQACSKQSRIPLEEPEQHFSAERLRAVDDLIRAHLAHDIGVADMARAAGYSSVYFSRLFSRTMGLAPYRYLLERRMEAVRGMLCSSASLAEIAVATGFCNQEHMTRVFRQHHGTTPGCYRRDLMANVQPQ